MCFCIYKRMQQVRYYITSITHTYAHIYIHSYVYIYDTHTWGSLSLTFLQMFNIVLLCIKFCCAELLLLNCCYKVGRFASHCTHTTFQFHT